jgi:hypothetical protein
MAQSKGRTARKGSAAEIRLRSHPAVIALVRLLARQAAREALSAPLHEQENNRSDEAED